MPSVNLIVNQVLSELSFADDVQETHSLRDDLGFDSLGLVELIVALEDAFGVELEMSDLDPVHLARVSDLYALMGGYVRGEAYSCAG